MSDKGLKEFLCGCLSDLTKPSVLFVFLILIVGGAFALMPAMHQRSEGGDACRAWRYLGENEPSNIAPCCADIEKWGDLTGSYKKTCCENPDFAKSSDICKEQKSEQAPQPEDKAKVTAPIKNVAKCDKSKITVSCTGKHLSTMSNGVYDAIVECRAEGCLPGYTAVVNGAGSEGAYNFKLKDGESKKWTAKFGGVYDNPNPCRGCAIVRDSDEKAVKWESPCSGGNMTYTDKKWGGGDKGHTNCSVTFEG